MSSASSVVKQQLHRHNECSLSFSSVSPPYSSSSVRRPCTLPLLLPLSSTTGGDDGPPSSVLLPSSSAPNRKRRAAGTLSRIDLSAVTTVAKELCCSSESLNNNSSNAENEGNNSSQSQQSAAGGEHWCDKFKSIFSSAGVCSATPLPDGLNPLKRLRLCSTSSISSSDSCSSSSEPPSAVTALQKPPLSGAIQNLLSLAELEYSHGDESSSPKQAHFASGGLVIGNELEGRFELVGDGRNCKAVDSETQAVFHCQVMKSNEWRQFSEVMARIQAVSNQYSEEDFELRRDLLLPLHQLRVARAPNRNTVYVLLPDHHGNLHQLVEEELFGQSRQQQPSTTRHTERKMQPILAQIAILLEFCHRIGLFFRDFRLRKFVFTDVQKSRIRVNNVLDLCLAEDPNNDSMSFREFVPAYVAPEILDRKNDLYGGRAADVWAFGVLVFTLLNGRYPFFESSPSPIALLRRIRAHRLSFPINESLSDSIKWLLHALLHHNPEERPTAAELLSAHWFRRGNSMLGGRKGAEVEQSKSGGSSRSKTLVMAASAGRLTPVQITPVAGRISPPAAAQVPTSTVRLLMSPVGGDALVEEEQQQQRGQQGRANFHQGGSRPAEWTRHVQALLAHEPLVVRSATEICIGVGMRQQHQRVSSPIRQMPAGPPPTMFRQRIMPVTADCWVLPSRRLSSGIAPHCLRCQPSASGADADDDQSVPGSP